MSITIQRVLETSTHTLTTLVDGHKTYGVSINKPTDDNPYIWVEFKTTKTKQGNRYPRTVRRFIAANSPAGRRLLAILS